MLNPERRRETNRVNARRHYTNAKNRLQAMRDVHTELELKYAQLQDRLQKKNADGDLDFSATRHSLLRENRALRQRNDAFLRWEYRANVLLGQQEDEKDLTAQSAQRAEHRPFGLAMKKPLVVEECHAIAQKSYVEIEAFMQCEDYVSTGMTVFGWTDRRRLDEGMLKFSLQKTFRQQSAYELITCTWAMIRNVDSYEKLYSANMNMRCERVQEIDPSNVLFFQEYEVSVGDVLTVVRSLVLATLFETYNGYITLFYSVDPSRLERWPEDRESVDGITVQYQWQHMYGWTRSEVAGPNGEYCKCSYSGAVPTEAAGIGFWMAEVLVQVLRWENLVIGPLVTLANDSDAEAKVEKPISPPQHDPPVGSKGVNAA